MRDASLRTTISQFSSTGGQQQLRAANVRAVEPAADLPGAERGNLYMLVEVAGSTGGHPAMYRRILDAAQKSFYEAEGTMSAALQRAVRSAHGELRKINEALPEANWRAGISCLAMLGTELVVAQVNPALVIVSHPKTVDLFPPDVPSGTAPLGGLDRPEVQLARTTLESGSMIVLAENRWLEHVRPEILAAAATGDTPAQVVDYLGQLAEDAELSALVIGVGKDIPEVQELGAASAAWPAGSATAPMAEQADAETAPAPEYKRGLFGRRGGPARNGHPEPESYAPSSETTREPVMRMTAPQALLVQDVLIEERPKRSPWPLVLALVIIPLLIAVVVFSVWWLRTQTQEKDFQTALTGANAAIASAQELTDEAAARERLVSAKEFLDKAKAIKPQDSRLQPVQTHFDTNMDRVNRVTPLYGTVPLWTFSGDGRKLTRALVKSNQAFALDSGLQQVDHLVLSALGDSATPADPAQALAKRQQVKDSTQVVGDLIDMTWVEAVSNQRSRLLVLDSNNTLYSYDVTFGPTQLTVGGRDQWGTPQLLAGYGGNLYVVDTKANQIWRYKPTEKGYENAPESYFAQPNQVDLAGVQLIAIDGNIWLLFADGRLLKFFAGEQKAFELKGLPTPLSNPVSVVASAEGDQIYIADSGNGRIVEINKQGEFQRQLRPAQPGILSDMRNLYLDEAGGALYILTNKQLFKASLPKASAPAPTPTPQK